MSVQLFQIDTSGCMKVIRERKMKQSELIKAMAGNSRRLQQVLHMCLKTFSRHAGFKEVVGWKSLTVCVKGSCMYSVCQLLLCNSHKWETKNSGYMAQWIGH